MKHTINSHPAEVGSRWTWHHRTSYMEKKSCTVYVVKEVFIDNDSLRKYRIELEHTNRPRDKSYVYQWTLIDLDFNSMRFVDDVEFLAMKLEGMEVSL